MATDKQLSKQGNSVQRMAALAIPFGVYQEDFHPKTTGFDYKISPTLKPLEDLRNDFTVFSHLQHDVKGGHAANGTFLNGIKGVDKAKFKDGNITLDQVVAEKRGHLTRFPSLAFGNSYSVTRTGVRVPSLEEPAAIFKLLFINQTEAEKSSVKKSLANSESILDLVMTDAKDLSKTLGKEDKEKLDEYFKSIRGTEKKFNMQRAWMNKPKPKVDEKKYKHLAETEGKVSTDVAAAAWLELAFLALQTDSSRIVMSGFTGGHFKLEGIDSIYHTCSHHGLKPDKLAQLAISDKFMLGELSKLIKKLKATKLPNGENMLQSTQVLFGSGMGSGSRHTNSNLPLILAGGRYKHGQHINANSEQPLCNLYHTMIEHALNEEIPKFNVSKGRFSGLEMLKA